MRKYFITIPTRHNGGESAIKTGAAAASFAALFVVTAALHMAHAQSGYPNKPVLVILPLQAAGLSDVAVRVMMETVGASLSQRVVVENQPRAASLIGTERAAGGKSDGYTLGGFNNSIITILPNMYANMP